jgi:PAS domain S-box-containing protein
MSKLRFIAMSGVAWTIVGGYVIAAHALGQINASVFLANTVVYIAANLVGMFSSYHRELYIRRDFFYAKTIQELEEKKHHLEKEHLQQAVDAATKSLRESEARFRTLAETTTAAIFIHQGERFLYVNPAGERIGGYSSEELLKKDFWTFIHPDYQEIVRVRGQARVVGEQVPSEYEFKFIRKNGQERWATLTTGFIEYKGIPAIIATLFDITDLKRAEAEKMRLCEQRMAEEKRHIMEKEKLMMDLHDGIGGITTNISILSELAQKAKDMDSVTKTLVTISQLSREGASEIRSFMQSLDSEELSWHALTAEIRKQGATLVEPHRIRFAAETSVHDPIEQPGSLLWVNLLRIYKEALTNVVKHSRAESVAVTFHADQNGLQLIVQDDGIGLDKNRQHGRGLPNMKRRVQDVGGAITISAAGQQGTQVMLEVPIPVRYPISRMDL